ncbi:Uncharacterised protein [[Clostridium] sordellii]|uniref:Hypothetical phage protein n=1 Tax=Paraclostridium sordellii TaxID=1505 RepID=A0ABP1XWQ5_PARSO|nr:hypothetical protein [Paeniclostridium sordellii]EPZ54747.1 hypothetical protein H477_3888 [[Clostridium] sordellii ATCC 9714] [Paeniclostridium sordellii ATCC 9714]CEJ74252.1 hypothetical phage protein [[Clostridium] sordellii] [Paeniclostridium sordellii]CEN69794.1 Uncharacterised protein [[Clostridium] sordellii] [Paeniclostridium sordellii]CEN73062.1 Uncharacterised protein [[Clostridium] sordellii] [Paeniclostridium sordellii]CEO25673.1 Uncharacterised protein [[Clostridium] sordellii]
MAAYMITYDLNSEGQNYEKVIKAIKDSSIYWCTFWKSSYLIKSNLTPGEIQGNISPYLDGNDTLLVIEANNNYQGWLSKEDWEFIREKIFDQ